MISVTINGKGLTGREGETILELARRYGIVVPALCAERRLDPFDSCGVCAVEVEGVGVVRACSTPVKDGMAVATDSQAAQEIRKTALDLLLSHHFGDCVGPCQLACPAHTDCQGYVSLAANGLFLEGLQVLYEKLPFPASFGRICPAPCEEACRRQIAEEPVQIRHMKRFLGDRAFRYIPSREADTGFRVAIVGGGPAGLSAAYFLRRRGHGAVVFDAMPKMGGMLRYGIPDFRLPQGVLDRELAVLQEMGIEFHGGVRLGADLSLDALERDYDAVFLGLGAWESRTLSVPHEDHPAVLHGIDFLRRLNMGEPVTLPGRVAVIGGGNTAIDAARSARRLGAEVTLVYRRSREEMPAIPHEVAEAEEEGVRFRFLTQPVEFVVEGQEFTGIRCIQMRLGEPDASGRARPVPVPESEFLVPSRAAILALGQALEPSSLADSGIRVDEQRRIVADPETGQTCRERVFAGGDAASGPSIAIEAVAAARRAADAIDRLLRGLPIVPALSYAHEKKDVTRADLGDVREARRVPTRIRPPAERVRDLKEYTTDFTDEEARREGERCLSCGCARGFHCALRDYSTAARASQETFAGELARRRPDERHPFIVRDPEKCIACGRCLRICGEVCGIYAIDFAGRGIAVEVEAPFDRPWQESACVSCGACVDTCPTGALADRVNLRKQVPLRLKGTATVCSLCGLACPVEVRTLNGRYLATLPRTEGEILCAKGRYGWQAWTCRPRLSTPLVRKGGGLVRASWEEAFARIKEGLPVDEDRIAVLASGHLTNEEGYLLSHLARTVLHTDLLGIEDLRASEPYPVPASLLASTDAIPNSDLVLVIGPRSRYERFLLDLEIRRAKSQGATITSLRGDLSEADLAIEDVSPASILERLRHARRRGSDELDPIRKQIAAAKNPVFVFEEGSAPAETARAVFDLAAQSKNGRVVRLRAVPNLNGLLRVGFPPERSSGSRAEKRSQRPLNQARACLACGADPGRDSALAEHLAGMDFVVAMAPTENATTHLAHVILPVSLPIEGGGHLIDTDGRVKELSPAAAAPFAEENWEILVALASALGADWSYRDLDAVTREVASLAQRSSERRDQACGTVSGSDSLALEVEEALRAVGI